MLPLVHLFAEVGLKLTPGTFKYKVERTRFKKMARNGLPSDHIPGPDPEPYETVPIPLFVMAYQRKEPLHRAMEEGVQLGLEANKENWGADRVELEFEEWYDEKIETIIENREKKRKFELYQREEK